VKDHRHPDHCYHDFVAIFVPGQGGESASRGFAFRVFFV
jgi:hypothetical protein